MPRRCIVCHRHLTLRERFLCLQCLADLPFTHFWQMSHNPMADKFNGTIQRSLPADGPLERYAYAAALFFYNSESGYRRIPRHLKYEGGVESGRYFGRMLGERLAESDQFADVDCIVPVPLHWLRCWRRGYNQAEVIARAIASAWPAQTAPEVRTDVLRRRRRTRTQTRLSLEAKALNVRGAFAVRPGSDVRAPRHILLVDDTFTTGATLNACREALRGSFPADVRISAATLAFVKAS